METEILFTASKWDILQAISLKPSSPLEIAKKQGTTIANVSQQLRLLEAAGLVIKKRIANSMAGKPRALFSLKRDICYLTLVTNGVAKKDLVPLQKDQTFLSRVWLLKTPELTKPLALFFYGNEKFLNKLTNLYFKSIQGKTISLETTDSIKKSFTIAGFAININSVKKISEDSELLWI